MDSKKTQNDLRLSSKSPREPSTMEELLSQTGYKPHGLKKGGEIEGTITALSPKGIIIDIGAKTEGLVLEKDKRILSDLLSTFKVGDKVLAQVLNPESEEGFSVLSLRRLRKNKAWQAIDKAAIEDQTLKVNVLEIGRSGLLVEYKGIRGFIPLSQLTTTLDESLTNKSLEVKVLEVDRPNNRLVFSQKASTRKLEDVKKALSKIKIGQVLEGFVSGITKFGIFVEIKAGIEGLVHISEISWEKVDDLEKKFKIGDRLNVMVIGVDLESQKLNLSLKQLLPDPWAEVARKFAIDAEVKGRIRRVLDYGAIVSLTDGIEGFILNRHLPIGVKLREGDRVSCIVESVDREKRRISLIPILKGKPIGYK